MKDSLTEIVLVLDRSGSMAAVQNDAEGGLRAFVKKQRDVKGDAVLTFYKFDTVFDKVFEAKPLAQVEDNDLRLEPRGCTALLDAMGRAINEVGARLSGMKESERPGRVIFLTVTDGDENSSREFTREGLFNVIKRQKDRYNWDFVFVGADQDAIAVGVQWGLQKDSILSNNSRGYGHTYSALHSAVSRSRTQGVPVTFSDSERSLAMTDDDDEPLGSLVDSK